MITREELREALDRNSPLEWQPHARGIVFLANTDEDKRWMFQALRDWAKDEGFALRLPHHSVSPAGLAGPTTAGRRYGSELDLAVGGFLVLDDFADFDDHGLYNIRKRILAEQFPVVVVGIDTLGEHAHEDPDAYKKRLVDKAETLGLSIITIDDLEDVAAEPDIDVSGALAQINRHRAQMGMRRLDRVAAGWTEQDVLLEAERIGRLSNPLLDLKRGLLQTRQSNQGYGAQEYPVFPVTKWNQTYVFPLTKEDDALLRRVAREEDWRMRRMEGIGPYRFARMGYHVSAPDPIDDPPFSLVEVHGWRGWWAEPARDDPEGVVFWNFIEPDQTDKELERDLGRLFMGPSANPEDDIGRGRAANPERWLAPKLDPEQRRRLKQLHDVYFDLFYEVESLPDATLTTETGEYTVPEGYALVYRVGGVDYMFFQDEAPDETWTFVTVGRGGENDRVEHLRDYLAVLERVNALVTEQVRRRPNQTVLSADDYEYLREIVREGPLDHFRFMRQRGMDPSPDDLEDEKFWTRLQAKLLAEREEDLTVEEVAVLHDQFGFLDDPHYPADEDDAAATRIRGRLQRLLDQRPGDWEAAVRRERERIFRSMF